MKRYPIGIQDFEKMRSGDYLYVDKTELIHSLIQNGAYYFLSRPRRFGKSLLLSTLKYIFQGRKDLCEGLWIGSSDFSFDPHPVLHFHFESLDYQGVGLEQALSIELKQQAKKYGLTLTAPTLKQQFKELIHTLGHEQGVVILVDEYDKPLVEYIDDPVKAEVNREIIRNFFSVIKSSDAYLRFFLVTGVSRFSKVSLFSDLNNLQDITLHYEYATIAGYTQDELERYFSEAFIQVAQRYHMTEEELTQQIRKWYNGYQWNVGQPVYNPFSILNFFSSQRFANYWWNTATPTFLLKLLRKNFAYDVGELTANIHVLDNLATDPINWQSLLFQTGYLTLKKEYFEQQLVTLAYPNREVELSMNSYLLATFRNGLPDDSVPFFQNLKNALQSAQIPEFITLINALFASIPYQLFDQKREGFFHAILHLTFKGIGLFVQSEVSTSKGRVDCVVQLQDHVYVIEFKLDASAKDALDQIREKRYGTSFLGAGKKVVALGINFSSSTRTIESWEAVDYTQLLTEG